VVDEISNKTLAVLLIVAIALSLGGTLVSLNRLSSVMNNPGITGYAAGTGIANVSVTSNAAIRFSVSVLNFGTGYTNSSIQQTCSMSSNNASGYSDGPSVCVNFTAAANLRSLVIENYGNINLSVTLNSTANASTMFGGPLNLQKFRYWVQENETTSCKYGLAPMGWGDMNTTEKLICSDLSFNPVNNSLVVHINFTIPYDVYTTLTGSERRATLTATGTPI
jgi:hypothetical protein